MALQNIVWQPIDFYNTIGEFSILLDFEFANRMLSLNAQEQKREGIQLLIKTFIPKTNKSYLIFEKDSVLVRGFYLGPDGRGLTCIQKEFDCAIRERRNLEYHSSNIETDSDRNTLMQMVDTYVTFANTRYEYTKRKSD